MADWQNLVCHVREADVETVENCLEEIGVLAISFRAAENSEIIVDVLDGEHRLWPVCEVSGLFDASSDLAALETVFSAAGVAPLKLKHEALPDRQWRESWREHFKPLVFGDRLCVCPTWHTPPLPDSKVVTLDPGMAFGTGNHATTAMCLQWLADHRDLDGASVLDYGCGTGILALAAAKLGAAEVCAVDIDTAALSVCRENIALNDVNNVSVVEPDAFEPREFDVVLANILLEPLIDLLPRFAPCVKPDGELVATGILQNQVDELRSSYAGVFDLVEQRTHDEWALVVWSPRASAKQPSTETALC